METTLLFIAVLLFLGLIIFSLKSNKNNSSDKLMIQLTNNLSNEIQNIKDTLKTKFVSSAGIYGEKFEQKIQKYTKS